jgi:hypothetical protein
MTPVESTNPGGTSQMSTRPPEPEFLIQWRELMRAGPPKCCHTCENFSQSGHCLEFNMAPPEDFASTVDACDKWFEEIPF